MACLLERVVMEHVVCFELQGPVIKGQLGKKAVKQDFCTQHSWDFYETRYMFL